MSYLVKNRVPWITFGALDALKKQIPPNPKVFEYGSGGSTLFWLDHGATVVSIEHDPEWHAILRKIIPENDQLDYRLVPPSPEAGAKITDDSIADPEACISSTVSFEGYNFREYVSQIDSFLDASFDIVVVDGRARPSCVKHGARKVKPGGLLILDNADIEHYTRRAGVYLNGFSCARYFGPGPSSGNMWATDIHRKPAA